jgi:hypothetical protein
MPQIEDHWSRRQHRVACDNKLTLWRNMSAQFSANRALLIWLEALTTVNINSAVFCDVTPCGCCKNRRLMLFLVHWFLSPWWWRRYVTLKRRFLQEPHSLRSQKMAFFRALLATCFILVSHVPLSLGSKTVDMIRGQLVPCSFGEGRCPACVLWYT